MTTKEKILAASDRRSITQPVEEWGCDVTIRTMSGAQRDAFEVEVFTGDDLAKRRENIRAKLLVRTLYDETGERIFGDADSASLGEKNSVVLERLYDIAAKLNGIRKGDIEELQKNS